MELCKIEGCTRQAYANVPKKQMCRPHYRKTNPNRIGKRGAAPKEVVEYRAAHVRVEKARGKAADHICADCGLRMATGWSLNPNVSDTLISAETGHYGYEYSLDVWSYSARCWTCHALMDDNFPPPNGSDRYGAGTKRYGPVEVPA